MAVNVYTKQPVKLLRLIKEAIANGEIDTWSVDSDGDFTHVPEQWNSQAWFRPSSLAGVRLVFNILAPKRKPISKLIYGVYHGRLAEMLLVHFDERIERVSLSAQPTNSDLVG